MKENKRKDTLMENTPRLNLVIDVLMLAGAILGSIISVVGKSTMEIMEPF